VAQFRVEFVLDQASGKYLAELYNPENQQELIVRTEALYPTQASAVLGLVELFKDAILKFPPPGTPARTAGKKAKKAKRKKAATKRRAGRARTSARRKPRKRARR
jgi:hypothetical protein